MIKRVCAALFLSQSRFEFECLFCSVLAFYYIMSLEHVGYHKTVKLKCVYQCRVKMNTVLVLIEVDGRICSK